jgi:hypothetical protein
MLIFMIPMPEIIRVIADTRISVRLILRAILLAAFSMPARFWTL